MSVVLEQQFQVPSVIFIDWAEEQLWTAVRDAARYFDEHPAVSVSNPIIMKGEIIYVGEQDRTASKADFDLLIDTYDLKYGNTTGQEIAEIYLKAFLDLGRRLRSSLVVKTPGGHFISWQAFRMH